MSPAPKPAQTPRPFPQTLYNSSSALHNTDQGQILKRTPASPLTRPPPTGPVDNSHTEQNRQPARRRSSETAEGSPWGDCQLLHRLCGLSTEFFGSVWPKSRITASRLVFPQKAQVFCLQSGRLLHLTSCGLLCARRCVCGFVMSRITCSGPLGVVIVSFCVSFWGVVRI